jgi:hypothetical protein
MSMVIYLLPYLDNETGHFTFLLQLDILVLVVTKCGNDDRK